MHFLLACLIIIGVGFIIFLWFILYRTVSDGFKFNNETHLIPILATALKVITLVNDYSMEIVIIVVPWFNISSPVD